jgi:RNA polymerase sigma-70 factor (ECF subfamily)
MGDRHVDNTTQGNLSLIGIGEHSSEKMLPSMGYLQKSAVQEPTTSFLNETARRPEIGHQAVFEFIYRLHLRRVYALCLRMVKEPAQAEDLTQETFIQVFRKIHTFRGEAAFASWLYRLTTNLVLMSFRQKTPASTSLDQITSDAGKVEFPELAKPDADLCGLFDRLNLRAAVPLLSRCCRAAFVLHDVHGYTHREVAAILGCSVGASKSYLYRAHKRLRELLKSGARKSGADAKGSGVVRCRCR